MSAPLFARFRQTILDGSHATAPGPLSSDLLLASDGALSVYYAPFDYVNPAAKVVVLGITPGQTQAVNALAAARTALAQGQADQDVLRLAKRAAGFSGAMRGTLVALLDAVGLQHHLGIASTAELFDTRADWLQTASALAFPTFLDGKNYNGTPDMRRQPLLKGLLTSHLVPLLQSLPQATFIPLGPKPTEALDWVAHTHGVRPVRVLRGLPHPSGANAERIAYFLGRKPRHLLSSKTDPDRLDAAKREIVAQLEGGRP